jgi:hypothetical protein
MLVFFRKFFYFIVAIIKDKPFVQLKCFPHGLKAAGEKREADASFNTWLKDHVNYF